MHGLFRGGPVESAAHVHHQKPRPTGRAAHPAGSDPHGGESRRVSRAQGRRRTRDPNPLARSATCRRPRGHLDHPDPPGPTSPSTPGVQQPHLWVRMSPLGGGEGTGMRGSGLFALRMAWRETRGAHRHFVYFLVCITVGVAALVGVQSFGDSLTLAIARSAKSLLGADVEIRAARPLSPGSAAVVAGLTREGVAVTRVRELVAMAQAGAGPRAPVQLVEL